MFAGHKIRNEPLPGTPGALVAVAQEDIADGAMPLAIGDRRGIQTGPAIALCRLLTVADPGEIAPAAEIVARIFADLGWRVLGVNDSFGFGE